jgi:hypothetical protein
MNAYLMRRLGTQVGTQVGGVASNACHDIKANCSTYITSVNLSKGDATKVTPEILQGVQDRHNEISVLCITPDRALITPKRAH